MLRSTPGLDGLDASSTSPCGDKKNASRHCQLTPGCRGHTAIGVEESREEILGQTLVLILPVP